MNDRSVKPGLVNAKSKGDLPAFVRASTSDQEKVFYDPLHHLKNESDAFEHPTQYTPVYQAVSPVNANQYTGVSKARVGGNKLTTTNVYAPPLMRAFRATKLPREVLPPNSSPVPVIASGKEEWIALKESTRKDTEEYLHTHVNSTLPKPMKRERIMFHHPETDKFSQPLVTPDNPVIDRTLVNGPNRTEVAMPMPLSMKPQVGYGEDRNVGTAQRKPKVQKNKAPNQHPNANNVPNSARSDIRQSVSAQARGPQVPGIISRNTTHINTEYDFCTMPQQDQRLRVGEHELGILTRSAGAIGRPDVGIDLKGDELGNVTNRGERLFSRKAGAKPLQLKQTELSGRGLTVLTSHNNGEKLTPKQAAHMNNLAVNMSIESRSILEPSTTRDIRSILSRPNITKTASMLDDVESRQGTREIAKGPVPTALNRALASSQHFKHQNVDVANKGLPLNNIQQSMHTRPAPYPTSNEGLIYSEVKVGVAHRPQESVFSRSIAIPSDNPQEVEARTPGQVDTHGRGIAEVLRAREAAVTGSLYKDNMIHTKNYNLETIAERGEQQILTREAPDVEIGVQHFDMRNVEQDSNHIVHEQIVHRNSSAFNKRSEHLDVVNVATRDNIYHKYVNPNRERSKTPQQDVSMYLKKQSENPPYRPR